MKKFSYLAVGALVLASSTGLLAFEAYSPIAYGAKSRGMGGVSIATVHGAESGLANPALLSFIEKDEVSLGLTYLKTDNQFSGSDGGSSLNVSLDEVQTFSPYAVASYKLSDSFHLGLGVTTFILSNDISNINAGDSVKVDIEKTRLTIPASYIINDFSIGAAIIYEKESFKVSNNGDTNSLTSDDFGYNIAFAYNFKELGLVLGADYKSEIEHKLTSDGDSINLNSPSEMGIGVSWNIANTPHTIGLDYKKIDSSSLINEEDSKITKNQDVIAVGYMYTASTWKARVGYRYVSDLYTFDNPDDDAFIGMAYPFASTSHYTLGGNYQFTDNVSADLAMVYATYEHTYNDIDGTSDDIKVESTPLSVSIGVNYTF